MVEAHLRRVLDRVENVSLMVLGDADPLPHLTIPDSFVICYVSGGRFDDHALLLELCYQLSRASGSEHQSLTNNFNENLRLFRTAIKAFAASRRPVALVLDGLEHFAHTRAKQSLLYNLFELVQDLEPGSLAILCLSPLLDVYDLLEKRIRSRFSHSKIVLRDDSDSCSSLDTYS